MRRALELKNRKHVTGLLPAYLDGALTSAEQARVERHLQSCASCRQSQETLQTARPTLNALPTLTAPERLWSEIEANIQAQVREKALGNRKQETGNSVGASHAAPNPNAAPLTGRPLADKHPTPNTQHPTPNTQHLNTQHLNTQHPNAQRLLTACASLLLIAVCTGVWFRYDRAKPIADVSGISRLAASWKVDRLDGSPVVGTTAFTGAARLKVGESLTTDARSRARVMVANIGQVEVAPNSQIRLVQTRSDRHRLALDRGELSARVTAPPRLFLVDTPSAVAVDLGCAYTLNVDAAGNSRLHVTKGCVALEPTPEQNGTQPNGVDTEVPAGAICLTRKGIGTGTPFFTNAPLVLQQAVQKFDFEKGGDAALHVIVEKARIEDTLTLFSLLPRVTPPQREKVIDGLLAYVAFPEGVTRAGVRKLDAKMLAQWKEQMVFFWY